ncbi:MAG: serine protease [Candidatus Obscuribacterales bacterium]|nr:serine protease [Candidatus Obscuribacterales bacterium]
MPDIPENAAAKSESSQDSSRKSPFHADAAESLLLPFRALSQPVIEGRALLEKDNKILIPTVHGNLSDDEVKMTAYNKTDSEAAAFLKARQAVVHITSFYPDGSSGTGSGFFVDQKGTLLTADHVSKDASRLVIKTATGEIFDAKVKIANPATDISMLELQKPENFNRNFPFLPLKNSSKDLNEESKLMVIGHPFGAPMSFLSTGHFKERSAFSDFSRTSWQQNPNHIMIDADLQIKKGNSGSPLINSKGEVVGIVNRDDNGRALCASSENIDEILGRKSSFKDYLIAESLHFGKTSKETSALLAVSAASAWTLPRFAPAALKPYSKVLAVSPLAIYGGYELGSRDLPYLTGVLSTPGTSFAEKSNAAIMCSSDLLLISSPIAARVPSLRRFALPLVAAGAGLKMANDILAYRKYGAPEKLH